MPAICSTIVWSAFVHELLRKGVHDARDFRGVCGTVSSSICSCLTLELDRPIRCAIAHALEGRVRNGWRRGPGDRGRGHRAKGMLLCCCVLLLLF